MTLDVNVSDSAKVDASNKNFGAGTEADYCDSSAQEFFLVRLALGHTALQKHKTTIIPIPFLQRPKRMRKSVQHAAKPQNASTDACGKPTPSRHEDQPICLPLQGGAFLLFCMQEEEEGKQKWSLHAGGYRWP